MSRRHLVITGPTASGKTRLAIELARLHHGEILSVDSRQVYKGMDIGTGKDLEDYTTGGSPVPCHLIDVVEPHEDFHLYKYLKCAKAALDDVRSRNVLPVLCGGSSLYMNALLDGYAMEGGEPDEALRQRLEALSQEELLALLTAKASPELLRRTDTSQRRRIVRAIEIASQRNGERILPPLENPLILAPLYPRQEIRQRIENRLRERLEHGLIEEVRRLKEHGLSWERLDWFGLEYRYVGAYLRGELDRKTMTSELFNHICNFAKSQDTWFRKMERDGKVIHWVPAGDVETADRLVRLWLEDAPLPPPSFRLSETFYGPVQHMSSI